MSNNSAEIKAALRRNLRAAAGNISPEARAAASALIADQLRHQPGWQMASSVMLYSPLPDEPDLRALIPEALAAGKRVTLPSFDAGRGAYIPRQVRDLAHDLAPGQFGILEPLPSCPAVDANRLDFLLIPGIGFTLAGNRIGRGKGFYDRLLAEMPGFKCGVAFAWQMAADIPMDGHDVLMNAIVTPERWYKVGTAGRA